MIAANTQYICVIRLLLPMKNTYGKHISFCLILFPMFITGNAYAQSNNPAPYCYPTAGNMSSGTCTGTGGSKGYGYNFNNVTLRGSSYVLGAGSSSCFGSSSSDVYRYWTNTGTIKNGLTYTIDVVSPLSTGNDTASVGAWIDYNQNGAFDTSEFLGSSLGAIKNYGRQHYLSFIVPCNMSSGTRRIRIRIQNTPAVLNTQACASPTGYGETWDFDVSIAQPQKPVACINILNKDFWIYVPVKYTYCTYSGERTDKWYVNDGGTGDSLVQPFTDYIFTKKGQKCIKLISSNCAGSDTSIKCFNVDSPKYKPVADFYSCRRTMQQYDYPEVRNITAEGDFAWEWDVYDSSEFYTTGMVKSIANGKVGFVSGNRFSEEPQFNITLPGNYTVVLKATNVNGSSRIVKPDFFRYRNFDNRYFIQYNYSLPANDYGYFGTASDGDTINTYPNKAKNSHLISSVSGEAFTFKFNRIKMADLNDSLIIYDDSVVNPSRVLCVINSADNYTTPSFKTTRNKVLVYFRSDSAGTAYGVHGNFFTPGNGFDYSLKDEFELGHDSEMLTNFESKFYNTKKNFWSYEAYQSWWVDSVFQPQSYGSDTLRVVFKDTGFHRVCLEAKNCDTTFYTCKTVRAEEGKGIFGRIFRDRNADCLYNGNDASIPNVPVKLYDRNNNLTGRFYSRRNGIYEFKVDTGLYRVEIDTSGMPFDIDSSCSRIDTAVYLTQQVPMKKVDFAMECVPGFDLSVRSVSTSGRIFPGISHEVIVNAGVKNNWYDNLCNNSPGGGQVQVKYTGRVRYVQAANGSLTPSVSGNILTYTVTDFSVITNWKDFNFIMLADTNLRNRDSVIIEVKIISNNNEADSSNNTFRFVYFAVNSYDPNYKESSPLHVYEDYSGWFYYTIHFQNTGTAPAYNIVLADSLDAKLDLETFELLNYSHPNTTNISGNLLKFRFDGIMLPDSGSHMDSSSGFVQYRMKARSGYNAGTQIRNTAYIYFDYNDPVVTNTTLNTYVRNHYVIIPDPAFVIHLNKDYPVCMDGNRMDTTCAQIKSESSLNVNGLGIKDLYGVQFFTSLKNLNCSHNQLSNLPPPAESLETLDCRRNQLQNLSKLPAALTKLKCSFNRMSLIPALPAGLSELYCDSNQLSALPALGSLKHLSCGNNLLNTIPQLPASLLTLRCDSNQLTIIANTLPPYLKELDCRKNKIDNLPVLNDSLRILYADNNLLAELPLLPQGLVALSCSNNSIRCFRKFSDNISEIDISSNLHVCLPNRISAMDSLTRLIPVCIVGDSLNNPFACEGIPNSGINESDFIRFGLYPNPGKDIFILKTDILIESESYILEIYNNNGVLIDCIPLKEGENRIDLHEHPDGIYLLRIRNAHINLQTFLIKQS